MKAHRLAYSQTHAPKPQSQRGTLETPDTTLIITRGTLKTGRLPTPSHFCWRTLLTDSVQPQAHIQHMDAAPTRVHHVRAFRPRHGPGARTRAEQPTCALSARRPSGPSAVPPRAHASRSHFSRSGARRSPAARSVSANAPSAVASARPDPPRPGLATARHHTQLPTRAVPPPPRQKRHRWPARHREPAPKKKRSERAAASSEPRTSRAPAPPALLPPSRQPPPRSSNARGDPSGVRNPPAATVLRCASILRRAPPAAI
jgi:hypothetical protein